LNAKSHCMKKVLIVEDELLLAMMNRRIVESEGFTVINSLTKGEDAVSYAREHEPDLILMDIFLAGKLDGVSAVEQIRKFSNTPVIFVSGNSDKATRARAERIHSATFVVKPVRVDSLKELIRNTLS